MAKCKICGGKMKKSTSPFGYVSWTCTECGYEEMANKNFQIPKKII